MVLGGTISIALITLPLEHMREIFKGLKLLLNPASRNEKDLIQNALQVVSTKNLNQIQSLNLNYFIRNVFRDGIELMQLGFSSEKIERILTERVLSESKRIKRVANSIRSLSKYPPAFGLIGTVLGLVNIMRQMSNGSSATQIGLEMSVALVATLYGLLVSNLIINPAGEALLKNANDQIDDAFLVVQAIVLASENTSILESQELLNSFVASEKRANILGVEASLESQAS
jgi:chemotaxis protein MotA